MALKDEKCMEHVYVKNHNQLKDPAFNVKGVYGETKAQPVCISKNTTNVKADHSEGVTLVLNAGSQPTDFSLFLTGCHEDCRPPTQTLPALKCHNVQMLHNL